MLHSSSAPLLYLTSTVQPGTVYTVLFLFMGLGAALLSRMVMNLRGWRDAHSNAPVFPGGPSSATNTSTFPGKRTTMVFRSEEESRADEEEDMDGDDLRDDSSDWRRRRWGGGSVPMQVLPSVMEGSESGSPPSDPLLGGGRQQRGDMGDNINDKTGSLAV